MGALGNLDDIELFKKLNTIESKPTPAREVGTPAIFDAMSSASDAIDQSPMDEDTIKMIITDLKNSKLLSEEAGFDEIFDYAESIASSENELMSKIGNLLMSPKAQMFYGE